MALVIAKASMATNSASDSRSIGHSYIGCCNRRLKEGLAALQWLSSDLENQGVENVLLVVIEPWLNDYGSRFSALSGLSGQWRAVQ